MDVNKGGVKCSAKNGRRGKLEDEIEHIKGEIKGAEIKRTFLLFLFAALSLEKKRHLNHPVQKMANLTALFLLGIGRTFFLPNPPS